ncbi:MAG: DUF2791 family P-loop domain-containing protein [Gammaproteobacteria bacterium]|nr:DUF2791 family P-loop domain-containing protein [Gammaproteobacteria bacterium]
MAIPRDEWLRYIDQEYLRTFISEGGAAVKFVVVDTPDDASLVFRDLGEMAARYPMVSAAIDSAATKLHMIQDVFFGIARQIDWPTLAQRFIEALFRDNGHTWPRPGIPVPITELAEANGVDAILLRREINQWLTRKIMRDTAMAQEFRVAMTRLCQERLAPADGGADNVTPVLEWLRGELRAISALRSAAIYRKVTRHNARSMLRSLGHWLRRCGDQGLLLTLDIRRLAQPLPPGSDGVRYSPAAVMDAHEVLRQLIDEADHLEGLLLVVLADGSFLNGDPKRSIDSYLALKMRIWGDVRARQRDNPLAPLVHLT